MDRAPATDVVPFFWTRPPISPVHLPGAQGLDLNVSCMWVGVCLDPLLGILLHILGFKSLSLQSFVISLCVKYYIPRFRQNG